MIVRRREKRLKLLYFDLIALFINLSVIQFIVVVENFPGGTPLYKRYRYMPPHRVEFLHRFGLRTGIHLAYFDLESGMVFDGTSGVYERIYRFNSK